MIHWIVVNVICPCFGTIAFALMFNVPSRFYKSCGVIGTCGWLVYCALVGTTAEGAASFFGSLAVVLISRVMTVIMKCPITMFVIPGIFPLIPGASVYYTAYHLVMNDPAASVQSGMLALKIAFGIALGIVCAVSIPRKVFVPDYWIERRQRS